MLLMNKLKEFRNRIKLEQFLYKFPDIAGFDEVPRRNNSDLIKNLKSREDVYRFICDREARDRLFERLSLLEHTYRPEGNEFKSYPYTEDPTNVYKLSNRELLRVYVLLEALKTKKFIEQIESLIEKNLRIPKEELGGLLILNQDGTLTLEEIASEECNKDFSYKMPTNAENNPHLAVFHLHAFEDDCTRYAGPSQGTIFNSGDLVRCDHDIIVNLESYNIIITKLPGRRFNIDYYGGDKLTYKRDIMIVLDLGNYEY